MEQVLNVLEFNLLGVALWIYLVAFGAIFLSFLLKKVAGILWVKAIQTSTKTKFVFDTLLLKAISKPAEWAIVLGGFFIAFLILPIPQKPVDIARFFRAALTGASVALVVWFAIRLVDGLAGLWADKAARTDTRLDDQFVPIARRSAKVFLVIIGIVLVLQNLGYSVGSLLAGLGIGGIVVAMASKDTMSNLFGSLVIFIDQPFQIGDWIEIDNIEGTVEEVSLRTTRIRTFSDSLITLPNLLFTTSSINNWSRMRKRRIKMTIGVAYATPREKIEAFVKAIREVIEQDEKILHDAYFVNFDAFGPSSLDIFIYCFAATANWGEYLEIKQAFLLKIMSRAAELSIKFALPTQSIHVESLPRESAGLTRERPV